MNRHMIVLFGMIGVLLISGCTQNDTDISEEDEEPFDVQETLFTESITFNDPNFKGQVVKNKITKTFTADFDYYINNSMEYIEFFGSNVSMVPFTVNFFCRLYTLAMFNSTQLNSLYESGNITSSKSQVEGYTATNAHVDFIDKEEGTKIAECTSTGPDLDDIEFKSYREYDSSFFGAEIGVFE